MEPSDPTDGVPFELPPTDIASLVGDRVCRAVEETGSDAERIRNPRDVVWARALVEAFGVLGSGLPPREFAYACSLVDPHEGAARVAALAAVVEHFSGDHPRILTGLVDRLERLVEPDGDSRIDLSAAKLDLLGLADELLRSSAGEPPAVLARGSGESDDVSRQE